MSGPEITEELLAWLELLDEAGEVGPWRSMLEGRDHTAGEDFIMVGDDDDRSEDIYVNRDSGPALGVDLDLIAASRTFLPLLITEIRRLQGLEGASDD